MNVFWLIVLALGSEWAAVALAEWADAHDTYTGAHALLVVTLGYAVFAPAFWLGFVVRGFFR